MEDRSNTSEEAAQLAAEFNLKYTSCIGSLIYLLVTRADIFYTANKLAKFMQKPGRIHFLAIIDVLRYLWDELYFGVCFYSDIE
jgi:hypothetical protein